jgi:hypothetical protein
MRTEAGKRPDFSPTSPRDEEYHQLKYLPRSNLVWQREQIYKGLEKKQRAKSEKH